jgi:hypothetical protein
MFVIVQKASTFDGVRVHAVVNLSSGQRPCTEFTSVRPHEPTPAMAARTVTALSRL